MEQQCPILPRQASSFLAEKNGLPDQSTPVRLVFFFRFKDQLSEVCGRMFSKDFHLIPAITSQGGTKLSTSKPPTWHRINGMLKTVRSRRRRLRRILIR